MRHAAATIAIAAMLAGHVGAGIALASTDVSFKPTQRGPAYDALRRMLAPEFQDAERDLGITFDLLIDLHDLDGDGREEMFVTFDDDVFNCTVDGCPNYVIRIGQTGYQMLGKVIADRIVIQDGKSNGLSDLQAIGEEDRSRAYRFDGETYAAVER